MKNCILCIKLCFLLVTPAFASTTVNSEFVITNRTIDSANFKSTDTSATFTDTTGSGYYLIHDNFSDANIPNLLKYGNHQIGFKRTKSLFSVRMTGQQLGHTFVVNGKYANSSFRVDVTRSLGVNGFYNVSQSEEGCTGVSPVSAVNFATSVDYSITSSNNINANCIASASDIIFSFSPSMVIKSTGISRDVYLDLAGLQKNKSYRDAPPDIYYGETIFPGENIKNRVGDGYPIYYTNKIKITKNPYFENVSLPPGDNVFTVKKFKGDVRGDLVIPYVINGLFTPYNSITLTVTSSNGFRLKDNKFNEIPYSLTTGIGSQREYPLATSGTSNGPITITNLPNENYALQGRFNASFSINQSAVQVGEYTDTLTAMFEIAL